MGKRILAVIAFTMIAAVSFAQKVFPELIVGSDTVDREGRVQIPIILKGVEEFCAFQLSVFLPDSIGLAAESDDLPSVSKGELCTNHEIDYNLEDSILNVACLSLDNSLFAADSGTVCVLNLQADRLMQLDKVLPVWNVELSTPGVNSYRLEGLCFTVFAWAGEANPDTIPVVGPDTIPIVNPDTIPDTIPVVGPDTIPEIVPVFTFNVSPFTFNGSLESAIVLGSDIDISSISFRITVPETFASNNLIRIISRLMSTAFKTEITQVGDYSYDVKISALGDSMIPAGTTEIAGVAVDYVLGLIKPDVYVFTLDYISVTGADGKKYDVGPQVFRLDLTSTMVESYSADSLDNQVEYYTIDGRRVDGPVKGITLVRHPDGRVTKQINR